jgi:dihydrofolate synthase / folylpolyglutamate synthase
MLYSEAIQFLYDLHLFGAKLGLENTSRLAALAGNPQNKLRFIHVAGTNGKGSTCAMLESIYRAAGLRVGLFTSPHLVAFGERIQVNRQQIAEAETVGLVKEMQALSPEFPSGAHPTFFEVVTVMALRYFADQKCDLVIWETGLGGRLDATNIVTPLASVITNIQFDHEKWLGESLPQIAAEKAGIIKPGIPVITAEEKPEALQVIADTARSRGCPIVTVSVHDTTRPPLDKLELPLLGEHQRLNAALAVATVRTLAKDLPVGDESIRTGLVNTHWPGRLQIVRRGAGRIVLDGAHNPAGATSLATALSRYFPGAATTIILGVLRDKDFAAMCRILAPLATRIILTVVNSERTADPETLRDLCRQFNSHAEVLTRSSLEAALESASADSLTVLTGSLHFVGEAMELLKISPAAPENERRLNDWNTVQTPNRSSSKPL